MEVEGVFNRDMQPSKQLVRALPQLESILDNPAITQAFLLRETQAVWWKRFHTFLGRTALLCLFAGMTFFDFELTLGTVPNFAAVTGYGAFVAAMLAGIAVASQFAMIFGKTKERWLIERFAAERLRCIRFQTFALIAQSDNAAELAANVTQFTEEGLARLDQELMAGRAAMLAYSPGQPSVPGDVTAAYPDRQLVRNAYHAYLATRLEVQAQHFDSQSSLSGQRSRRWMSLSEIAFALGGLLALAQIVNVTTHVLTGHAEKWLEFIALWLFIASAVLAVYQRGAALVPDAERYKHYARELHRLKARSEPKDAKEFAQLVDETEQIERRELFDFCRDAANSSYIF